MTWPVWIAGLLVAHVPSCGALTPASNPKLGTDVRAELEAVGQVEVMIALFVDAGGNGRTDAGSPAAIADARSAVLSTLDSTDFRLRQWYAAIPAFSGTLLSTRGLDRLLAHPLVRRVDRDTGGTGSIPDGPQRRSDTSPSLRRNSAQ